LTGTPLISSTVQITGKPAGRVRRIPPWVSGVTATGFKSPQNSAAITAPHPNFTTTTRNQDWISTQRAGWKIPNKSGLLTILKKYARGRCCFFLNTNKKVR
jgi:hypothetical protein